MSVDNILAEREVTHGEFKHTAGVAQRLKDVIKPNPGWNDLTSIQREALDMIVSKIARILVGDSFHKDSWDDIAGYATLAANELAEK